MLNKKLAEMNENGTLPIFKNYLANISANPTKVKSLSDFAEDGWYEVTDVDGFEKYLVYHYAEGKKISVRYIFGKTPKIQEANPKGFFGEIADVISVFAYDSTLAVSKLNTEEGSAVKIIGYDTDGNLVEDDIPEGIVVDDELNTESNNAIANSTVTNALNEKADTADLLDGTLIPNKALQAKSIEAVSTESGAVQDTPFIYQGTGTANGTSIADTSPVGKHLEKQGNSVVVNQNVANGTFEDSNNWSTGPNAQMSIANHVCSLTPRDSETAGNRYLNSSSYIKIISGHKYLMSASIKGTGASYYRYAIIQQNPYVQLAGVNVTAPTTTTNVSVILTASGSSDTASVYFVFDSLDSLEVSNVLLIDLTQWFSGNIPQDLLDHPENFFRYYNGSLAYNAGTLENSTGRYLTCGGRNVWDGTHDFNAIPNATYYCYGTSVIITYKDADGNTISTDTKTNETFVAPSNCLTIGISGSGDICISLYYTTGDSYDQYFPYEEPKVYDTGSEVLLAFDKKHPSGVIEHNTRELDLGDLDYASPNEYGWTSSTSVVAPAATSSSETAKMKCSKFIPSSPNYAYSHDDCISVDGAGHITMRSASFIGLTGEQIKSSVTGIKIQVLLIEPTTEQGTPFAENIEINDYGTMGWDSEVPQGCKIFYPADYALFIDSVGQRQDINWDALAIVSHTELNNETDALEAKDTQLLDAVGGTLRQLLAVKENIDFADTDFVDLGDITPVPYSYDQSGTIWAIPITPMKAWANDASASTYLMSTKYKVFARDALTLEGGIAQKSSSVIFYSAKTASEVQTLMKGVLLAYEKVSE